MDLTLPEIPGAIIGYRNDGRAIRLIAGASPDDPSNNDPADEPDEPATGDTDGDDNTDWKAEAQRYRDKYEGQRKVNRDLEGKLKAARTPTRQPATGDDEDGDVDDPRVEAARIAAIERELEAAAKSAAYTVGGGAPKLLDSMEFRKQLNMLDVDDADEFEREAAKLMRAELKRNPPAANGTKRRQGADMSGGASGQERPKSIREAYARTLG